MLDETLNLAVALLLIDMGAYMLFLTRLLPLRVRTVCRGLLHLFRPKKGGRKGEISPFEALSAALGGSVGTGNIAGVASAIAIGGAGAIFWMWVSGVIGMATKYAEVLLAMRYRKRGADGAPVGGTMYCILLGMGKGAAPLAALFAAFTLLASLGCGNMVQVNTIASAVAEAAGTVSPAANTRLLALITGAVTAAALGAVLLGGAKRVCRASAYVVPLMSALYIGATVWVILRFSERLPEVFRMIFSGAFGFRPAVGGAVGHNPISIIVPCHRVVGADGSLTGYTGGLDKKIKLLEIEGVDMSRFFVPKKGTALTAPKKGTALYNTSSKQ